MAAGRAFVVYSSNAVLSDAHETTIAHEVADVIRRKAAKLYASTPRCDRDDLENHALACVLRACRERHLPADDVVRFERYLDTVIKNGLRDGHRATEAPVNEYLTDSHGAVEGEIDDDEAVALLEELPRLVVAFAVRRNRFPEMTDKMVAYIATRLLSGEEITPRVVRYAGNLKQPAYYLAYAEMLVRWALYTLKEQYDHQAA